MNWLDPQLQDHFKIFFPRLAKNVTFPADPQLYRKLHATCRRWRAIFPLHKVLFNSQSFDSLEEAESALLCARRIVFSQNLRRPSSKTLYDVLNVVSASETLRKICINEFRLSTMDAKRLSDALGSLPNLASLELFRVADPSGDVLSFLPSNNTILSLHHEGRTDRESPPLKFISIALQRPSCRIRKLKCIGRFLTPLEIINLSNGIAANASLREIHCRALGANDESVEHLANAIIANKTLKKIDVYFGTLSAATMSRLVDAARQNASQINTLTIQNFADHYEDIRPIKESIFASSIVQLLQEPNCALQSFSLPSAMIADFASSFASANLISSSLSYLDLRGSFLGSAEITALMGLLQKSADGLKQLLLSGNRPENFGCDAISHYLQSNRPLRILELAACELTPSNIGTIIAGLRQNTILETLHLNSNEAGLEGAKSIGDVLVENCVALTSLDLRSNQLRFESVEFLAEALRANTTLLRLNLHDNWLTPSGIAELRKAMAENKESRIYFLDIGGWNELEPEDGNSF